MSDNLTASYDEEGRLVTTEKVVHPLPGDFLPAMYNKFDDLVKLINTIPYYCSINSSDTGAALKTYNYKNCFANGIQKMKVGGGIFVRDVMVFHNQYINKEGEEISGPNMVLIEPNGDAYRISAKYLIKQILEFMRDFASPPYEEPVKMRCVDVVLDSGHRMYQLKLGD